MEKEYLGDSVYVQIENGMIKLTTENGLPHDPSNEIFLELEVMEHFINYYQRAIKFYENQSRS